MNLNINIKLLQFITSISGILFWFIVAFPFENRNESFSWITQIESSSLIDSITKPWPSIVTFRPLSQSISWVLYNLANNEIYLIQFFNYVLLILAIFLILKISKAKLLTAILFSFGYIFFISAFYYLFHVHGIFYSPLILYCAYLFYIKDDFVHQDKRIVLSLLIAMIVTLLHSYAIVIFTFYISSQFVIHRFKVSKLFKIILPFTFIFLFLIIVFNNNQGTNLSFSILFLNLKTSLYNVEVSGKLSIVVLFFSILSVLYINKISIRIISALVIIFLSIIFFLLGLPLFLILVFSVLIKLFYKKEWVLLSILIPLIIFPAIVSSGAATKSSLFIPFLIFAISLNLNYIESTLLKQNKIIYWILIFLLFILSILSRLGNNLPLVDKITQPILIERDKTYQLSKIIDWYLNSDFKDCKLILSQDQASLNIKTKNLERNQIPPTVQGYLDEYISAKKKELSIKDLDCEIYVTFGNVDLEKILLKEFHSNYAGIAKVYH